MSDTGRVLGGLVSFPGPGELLNAARQVRAAGYRDFDCHSPFPIHGMNEAMGLKRSRLGWIAGAAALVGGSAGLALQGWTSTQGYPLVISGKPLFSFLAYIPITFALAVLLAAFGALLGFLALAGVRHHHPLFYSDRFAEFSDDGFFVSISADDPNFDETTTTQFLKNIGGEDVEIVKGSQ